MKFEPGKTGNPKGRPKGSFARHTQLAKLMRDEGEDIIRKCINLAKQGDTTCIKICMDKILPNAKKDSLDFQLPDLVNKTPEELVKVLFESMSHQTMSADEINCVLNMIKTFRSNEDATAVQEVITKSNEILDELRKKNEREY